MEIPGELLREITNTILKSVHDKDKLYEKIDNEMIKKSDVAFTKDELKELLRPFDFEKQLREQFPEHIITTSNTELLDILLKKLRNKLD